MSEMLERGVEALKRLPVRDRETPGSELDELRLREAVRAVIQSLRVPTEAIRSQLEELCDTQCHHQSIDDGWGLLIDAALK